MDQTNVPETNGATVPEKTTGVDPARLERFKEQLKAQQNLPMGILAGAAAAIVGAAIWAVVTVVIEYQIGWMAVGVGFLVGYAVRLFGKGVSNVFGIAGAVLALSGCVLGNLFSTCGFLANQESVPLARLLGNVLTQPAVAIEILKATFSPMDILFYGIAVYEGYKFSFRQITQEELTQLNTPT